MSNVNAAHACFMRGDLAGAESILNTLLQRNPNDPDALSLSAGVHHARGDFSGALALFDRAVEQSPYDILIVFNRAALLAALGRHEEAIEGYSAAIKLRPDDGATHFAHGASLAALARHEAALAAFDEAERFGIRGAEMHTARASSLSTLLRHDDALAAADAALAIAPGSERALTIRGVSLLALERPAEALAVLDAVLAIAPSNDRARASRSTALANLGRFDEALSEIESVIARDPARADPWRRRAYALTAANRTAEAIVAFDRFLALKPSDAEGTYGKADALLSEGDFAAGLPLYEQRAPSFATSSLPKWTGTEDLAGKSILVLGEQGFGDLFQFCRFIPLLAARARDVTLQERPQTLRLMRSLDGEPKLVSTQARAPRADYYVSLASLMHAFGVRLDTIPANVPYLRAGPDRVAHWRETLGPARRKRVGVCWAGAGRYAMQLWRKLDAAPLARLLEADVEFVSLQMNAREMAPVLQERGVRQFGAAIGDFAELAALIETLDLVISIDTAVAHLAGALGKPVWVLLPFRADWRWLLDRSDSPWYPTARLFRQPRFGDWDSVIDAVRTELQ